MSKNARKENEVNKQNNYTNLTQQMSTKYVLGTNTTLTARFQSQGLKMAQETCMSKIRQHVFIKMLQMNK
jgi:hypothetical protein